MQRVPGLYREVKRPGRDGDNPPPILEPRLKKE